MLSLAGQGQRMQFGQLKGRNFICTARRRGNRPLAAHAHQSRETRRIAVLIGTAPTDLGKSYLATFLQRLERLGWS
jgi:hypothetical protein